MTNHCHVERKRQSNSRKYKRNLTESVVTNRNTTPVLLSSLASVTLDNIDDPILHDTPTIENNEPPTNLNNRNMSITVDNEYESSVDRKNQAENIINQSDDYDQVYRPCLIDQICCRLIGSYLNDGVDVTRKFSFRIGFDKFTFEPCSERVECTKNMKMRCYELIDAECYDDIQANNVKFNEAVALMKKSVIITFNWFNPTGILDYISLGKRLLDPRLTQLSSKYPNVQIGDIYKELAEIFYETNAFKRLLKRVKKQGKRILISGFSLGGAISLAISPFVHEFYAGHKSNNSVDPSKKVRVVTFGSPRTGNDAYVHYCNEILHADSACYVMSSNGGNTDMIFLDKDNDIVSSPKKNHWSLMSNCVNLTSNVLDSRNLLNESQYNSMSIICRGIEDQNHKSDGFISKLGCNEGCRMTSDRLNRGAGAAVKRQESLMYDPVCIAQISNEDHDENLLLDGSKSSYAIANPNTYLMIKELGLFRPLNNADLLYWKWLESSSEYMLDQGLAKTVVNFISRRSPFTAKFDEAFNELHSISVYYAAMLGLTDTDNQSTGAALM